MPLSPTATRDLLARLGHTPRRFLGQNFLVDGNIVRKSLAFAELRPGDTVIEIGPGLGTLTEALLEAGAVVWAVEKDPRLHQHLAGSLLDVHPATLHLLSGDAMAQPLAGLTPADSHFKIVANLPYAISTPWMDLVLNGPLPERMVLMLQQEAAQRYTARPGTKSFGAISIFLQSAYTLGPSHAVPSGCFQPRPEVDSVLLTLLRKPAPCVFSPVARELIRACFQQRRKQLGAILRRRLPDGGRAWLQALEDAGLPASSRPEQVPAELWQVLSGIQPSASA